MLMLLRSCLHFRRFAINVNMDTQWPSGSADGFLQEGLLARVRAGAGGIIPPLVPQK